MASGWSEASLHSRRWPRGAVAGGGRPWRAMPGYAASPLRRTLIKVICLAWRETSAERGEAGKDFEWTSARLSSLRWLRLLPASYGPKKKKKWGKPIFFFAEESMCGRNS